MLAGIVPFDRSCWHTVDPGTVLFTGSLNQNIGCSGTWLATYEYVIDDVNKWWFLARSGRIAGATSLATHGDLSRSPRHRSHEAFGIGDELRVSFVIGGTYWAAASLLRDAGERWFTEEEVRCLASLSEPIADGFRRALLVTLCYGCPSGSPMTRLCMQGLSTRQMANALALSPHTVQDHLKSIFAKTGVRSRSDLVGQIFLEHYVPRWEDLADSPAGWFAKASPIPAGGHPDLSPAPDPVRPSG